MSSVLRPVGPEPEERYWVRRVAVLAAVLVALVVIVALVTSATGAGSAVQAAPAPPPPPAPVPVDPTPSAPATTSPAATASPTMGATSTPSASPTAKPSSSSTRATVSDQKTPAKKTPAKKKAPVLAACPVDALRTTLTGKRSLRVKQRARFDLSLINGSGRSCYLRVTGENVTVTIYSGRDRIWSSKDCGKAVPTLSRKLGREQALKWSMTWNGRRSAKGCETRSEIPRPGTYWANAQFDDAKPVRLRMVLHA